MGAAYVGAALHKIFTEGAEGAAFGPEILDPAGDGAFEFQRTVCRRQEMHSKGLMELDHAGA